jgi:hypothetical protein
VESWFVSPDLLPESLQFRLDLFDHSPVVGPILGSGHQLKAAKVSTLSAQLIEGDSTAGGSSADLSVANNPQPPERDLETWFQVKPNVAFGKIPTMTIRKQQLKGIGDLSGLGTHGKERLSGPKGILKQTPRTLLAKYFSVPGSEGEQMSWRAGRLAGRAGSKITFFDMSG